MVLILMQSLLLAATVKKKNGEVIVGEIKGRVVTKASVQTRKDGPSTSLGINYNLIDGKTIEAIDENGIRGVANTNYLVLAASHEKLPPADASIFGSLTNQSISDGSFSILPLHAGGTLVILPIRSSVTAGAVDLSIDLGKFTEDDAIRITRDFQGEKSVAALKRAFEFQRTTSEAYKRLKSPALNWTDRIIGELRIEGGKGTIKPGIELETKKGTIVIPVSEIVAFRGRAKRPPPR